MISAQDWRKTIVGLIERQARFAPTGERNGRVIVTTEHTQNSGEAALASRDSDQHRALRFGRHIAFPMARAVLLEGVPVCLGGRAFDLLMVLLRSRGRVVCKDEIIREVWPTTYVDESNLRFQMTSLRKALGESRDLIKTIPGRGYLLAVDVYPVDEEPQSEPESRELEFAEIHCPERIKDALRTFLSALRHNPDAAAALEAVLAA